MTERTPGPWENTGWDNFNTEELEPVLVIGTVAYGGIIALVPADGAESWAEAEADESTVANAEFIVTAVNAHDALVEAARQALFVAKGGDEDREHWTPGCKTAFAPVAA